MSTDEVTSKIDALAFQVDKSIRYHHRFRGFFDTVHRVFMFAIIVTGGGALLPKPQYYVGIAALLAAANLVWAPSHKARDHHLLHGRFSDLMIQIRSQEQTEENFKNWEAEKYRIEKDEPPIFYALEADCDNQIRRALGRDQVIVPVNWWQKVTMYIWRYSTHVFAPKREPA